MKIYTALLLSSVVSINAAAIDVEAGAQRPLGTPSDSVVIEMSARSFRAVDEALEHAPDGAIDGINSMVAVRSYDSGEESDLDEAAVDRVSGRLPRIRRRTRRLRSGHEVSPVAGSSPALEVPHFKVSDYYDRDEYLSRKIQKMILEEAQYDVRAKVYNYLGTGAMWVAGISGFATTVVSILGGASIIPPVASAVSTGCLGAFTTFCVWGSAQFKKSAGQYHQASTTIQVKLGVPPKLIAPQVDIRIDPLRNTGIADALQPAPTASSAQTLRSPA